MIPYNPDREESTDLGRLEERKRRLREAASLEAFLRITGETPFGDASISHVTFSGKDSAPTREIRPDPHFQIPGYEILGELGRGGMGVVYKARQVGLNRLVALKMVLADCPADTDRLPRFRAEAEAVARLQHPNVVQVYEIGEHAGRPFFSMEYVEGVSLEQQLTVNLLLPNQAAALVARLADAMDYAHQNGIIHRDLKPANVMLHFSDRTLPSNAVPKSEPPDLAIPKITDFGLAKQIETDSALTRSGTVLGTPSYMAPEQAAGSRAAVDVRADTYALGGILYAALTGRPPFRGATLADTLYQVQHEEPVAPSRLQAEVPRDLEVICLKCLRKEPGRRYATARDLADDLRRFLAGESILARPVAPAERAWRWCRRSPVVAGLLAAVAFSVLAGVAGVLYYAVRAEANARQAEEARTNAEDAKRRAQESAEQLRRGIIRQHVDAGARFLDSKDRARALWSFAKALELEDPHPEAETSHRIRLGVALQAGPQLVGACFHSRPVLDAVFDPTGKTVLTRTDEPRVYLWDPFAGRLRVPPLVHEGEVRAALFSPLGEQLATGCDDGTVRLWDAFSGQLHREITIGLPVHSLAYSPAGNRLAVATRAGTVRFLDPRTGKDGAPALSLQEAVYHVAFSPDGNRVVTADAGHFARVWDVATGQPITAPLPHEDHRKENEFAITYRCWPAFSPDGQSLVTVHPNRKREARATVRNLDTGETRYTIEKPIYFVRQVQFTPDGSGLWALTGNAGHLYDAATGKFAFTLLHPRETPHSCLHPDGKGLAACSTGGLIHLWDQRTRRETEEPLRCGDGVHALSYAPDGRHLLAASHDGTARVWRLRSSDRVRRYQFDCGHADRLNYRSGDELAKVSPDGRHVVYFGKAAGARLRVRGDAGAESRIECPRLVRHVCFTPNGQRFLTEDDQATLQWWDAGTGRAVAVPVKLEARLYSLTMSADGGRLLTIEQGPGAGSAGRVVSVWEVESGRRLFGPMREWESGPQRFGERELFRQIMKGALSPDGTRLALASDATGALGVWNVDSGEELTHTLGYRGTLYNVQFSHNGERFLTHGSDTIARLWSTATGTPAGPALRHPGFCRQADLGPDGWRVVTVDNNDVIRLWDGRTGELLGRIDLPIRDNRVWFSRDGRSLVVNGGQQVVDVPTYEGTREDLPALLQLLTGLQREQDETTGHVDPSTFLRDPDRYRRAWLTWRGGKDDPVAQPLRTRPGVPTRSRLHAVEGATQLQHGLVPAPLHGPPAHLKEFGHSFFRPAVVKDQPHNFAILGRQSGHFLMKARPPLQLPGKVAVGYGLRVENPTLAPGLIPPSALKAPGQVEQFAAHLLGGQTKEVAHRVGPNLCEGTK